jgi:catechol 2,3-dioxygenase-like lactoylglutathione lyase family enzyme
MPLFDIHHVAIKCKEGKLKESEEFYTNVFGMASADRPDLGFPGAWLDMEGSMFHLMELEFPPEVDPWYARKEGGSALDHIAIKAHNFDAFKKQAIAQGVDWRQNIIKGAGLWQLFVLDPNGIIVELNFDIADEPKGSKGPDDGMRYTPMEE